MGRRGPAPAPTNLRLLRGNPGKRKISKKEPKPEGIAAMPSWLSKDAKLEWKRLAPQLKKLGLLTQVDQSAMVAYCEGVADLKWATKEIAEQGRVTVAQSGYLMPHPAVAIKNKASETIRKFAQEFGFTPSARTRIEVPEPPKPKTPYEEWKAKNGPKRK